MGRGREFQARVNKQSDSNRDELEHGCAEGDEVRE